MCECMSFPQGSNKVLLTYLLTGIANLKKFQKSKINLDRAHPTHPPHPIFVFLETLIDMERTLKS